MAVFILSEDTPSVGNQFADEEEKCDCSDNGANDRMRNQTVGEK